MTQQSRPGWDEYFMNIATVVASRSSCLRRKVGAVVTIDNRIVSTGYNGTPRGLLNCDQGGCERCAGTAQSGASLSECLCSHAEENAVVQAARHGIRLDTGCLYTTFSPCLICSKIIVNSGIKRVVYQFDYPGPGLAMIEKAFIELIKFQDGDQL